MTSHTRPHSVSLFDARPFFEKALVYGVRHGILDQAALDAICNDAPKGMVQIARYFGTEFLRPELEKAKDRMVNLVSLNLESSTGGDLRLAAESLRDNSFLSRSKGGSDMLKTLIAMPQNSHFGMHESGGFTDDQIPLLAKWSLRTLPDCQAEFAHRRHIALLVNAAIWFGVELALNVADLEDAGKDAEAVIRTGLLALVTRRKEMPDWPGFEKLVQSLRKKYPSPTAPIALALPRNLPPQFETVVDVVRQSVITDMAKILDDTVSERKLFCQTPAFLGRYFWREDGLSEVDHFDRTVDAVWEKATQGHADESSLLTLFLCIAAGAPHKTLLNPRSAGTLIRKIRKLGLTPALTQEFIRGHAPHHRQQDYIALWESFLDQARSTLESDFDYALKDAMALLRHECNVGA